jgi:hypothetical protein
MNADKFAVPAKWVLFYHEEQGGHEENAIAGIRRSIFYVGTSHAYSA